MDERPSVWGERRQVIDTAGWREWWRKHGERELRSILMTAWDPIGVGDAPEAWGEYDSYAPQIVRILRETVDPHEAASRVATYLAGVERNSMELGAGQSTYSNARLGNSLVAWYDWSYARGGSPLADGA